MLPSLISSLLSLTISSKRGYLFFHSLLLGVRITQTLFLATCRRLSAATSSFVLFVFPFCTCSLFCLFASCIEREPTLRQRSFRCLFFSFQVKFLRSHFTCLSFPTKLASHICTPLFRWMQLGFAFRPFSFLARTWSSNKGDLFFTFLLDWSPLTCPIYLNLHSFRWSLSFFSLLWKVLFYCSVLFHIAKENNCDHSLSQTWNRKRCSNF